MAIKDWLSLVISCVAIIISATMAYLTFFRRGRLCMTRPTLIYFGPDGGDDSRPKIFFRGLLYSSAKRGHIVEGMFVRLRRQDSLQTFSFWAYGDDKPMRGSGLFIKEEGVSTNHHFIPSDNQTAFNFLPGEYEMTVLASVPPEQRLLSLASIRLSLTEQQSNAIQKDGAGIYFNWSPESQSYHADIRIRPYRSSRLES